MPYIRYDPNKPGDYERASREFLIGSIASLSSFGSIFYYIFSLVKLFNGYFSVNTFFSSGFLVIMAIADFYILYSKVDREYKKKAAKKYFLFFFSGAIDLAGIIAFIASIYFLCHNRSGVALLVGSTMALLVVSLVSFVVYKRVEGYGPISIRFLTDKTVSAQLDEKFSSASTGTNEIIHTQTNREEESFYCHKCGKKLPGDSEFCSSCGCKLK